MTLIQNLTTDELIEGIALEAKLRAEAIHTFGSAGVPPERYNFNSKPMVLHVRYALRDWFRFDGMFVNSTKSGNS